MDIVHELKLRAAAVRSSSPSARNRRIAEVLEKLALRENEQVGLWLVENHARLRTGSGGDPYRQQKANGRAVQWRHGDSGRGWKRRLRIVPAERPDSPVGHHARCLHA